MPSKKLSSRERVMKAIMHEEPDRVPIDLGGSITTGIVAKTLAELRKYLGLDRRPVKIYDVFQMLGEVEMDVIDRFEVDVLPIEPLSLFFKIKRKDYKPWIFQGEEFLVPGDFRVEVDEEGNLLLREGGDPAKPIVARMPKDGYYFEDLSFIHFAEDFKPPSLEEMRRKRERILTDEDLEFMSLRAELLRKTTDKALLLGCWPNVGLSPVGSLPNFLILLAQDRGYVKELMHLREEETIENLKLLWDALGNNIDIVVIDGFDFGTQQGEMISPDIFEEIYVPHYKAINEWVHKNTTWKTWQHICGSITRILPALADTGLDILNPVQTSAKGMDPKWLKEKFGRRLTFWGGGVDTQRTLPFGKPEEVEKEVRERIKIFAPGGGFVFAAIHNIQYGVPPENIVAAYDTVLKYGWYPIQEED